MSAWQERPLEPLYSAILIDALRVKIRDDGLVQNKEVHVALRGCVDGQRGGLGLWIEQTEGAKILLKVFSEIKTRGVQDILIAVVDGLTALSAAIEAAFPRTTVQMCIVHLLRNSLAYTSWKHRRAVAAALRPIHTVGYAKALEAFVAGPWGQQYPTIALTWCRVWAQVIPFFAFPPAVRRVLYTTNAIESLHMQLRKIIRTRGHLPTHDAALTLLWLAPQNVCLHTTRSVRLWDEALTQFSVFYGDRFTAVHR